MRKNFKPGCFQAQGDWTIKGNIKQKEGDKRSISILSTSGQKFTSTGKLQLDKDQEERKSLLFCFVSMAAIFCRKEKKIQRPVETIPPFHLRLHKT